jgi:hypothetical protein
MQPRSALLWIFCMTKVGIMYIRVGFCSLHNLSPIISLFMGSYNIVGRENSVISVTWVWVGWSGFSHYPLDQLCFLPTFLMGRYQNLITFGRADTSWTFLHLCCSLECMKLYLQISVCLHCLVLRHVYKL